MATFYLEMSTARILTPKDDRGYDAYERSLAEHDFMLKDHAFGETGSNITVTYFFGRGTIVYPSRELGAVFVKCYSKGWNNRELTPDNIANEGSLAISLALKHLSVESIVDLLNRPVRRELFMAHPDLAVLVAQPV
jgi:hypothetical protein